MRWVPFLFLLSVNSVIEGSKDAIGNKQSPVNIVTSRAKETVPNIILINYGAYHNFTLVNDGHAVLLLPDETVPVEESPAISYKNNTYLLDNVHYHWGNGTQGGEHALDGVKGCLEVHLIHSAVDPDAEDPQNIVLGVIYQCPPNGHDEEGIIRQLFHFLPLIRDGSSEVKGIKFLLAEMLPRGTATYYLYEGSLTQPPYTENVAFVMYGNMLTFSEQELQEFYQLKDKHGETLITNSRPMQPLNNRKIYIAHISNVL